MIVERYPRVRRATVGSRDDLAFRFLGANGRGEIRFISREQTKIAFCYKNYF